MKFLHITDTHLGYHQYGLEERAHDFFDVFNEAIDIAITEKVDFVIHTGDFFHTSRPSNTVFLQGIEILKRLQDANIPIFAIAGNHDRGNRVKDVSPLQILKSFNLKLIEQETLEFEGIHISGLKYLSKIAIRRLKTIREILERFLENGKDSNFHILMLHQEFQPMFPEGLFIKKEIPEDFNYIGIGHFHERQKPFKHGKGYVVYPGSTEFTAYSKNEEKVPKGVYLVERDENALNIKFVELKNRRPFLSYRFKEYEIEDTIKNIKYDIEKLREAGKKPPVIILNCEVEKISLKEITGILSENGIVPDKKGILYINFKLSRKEDRENRELGLKVGEINIKEELKSLLNDEELTDKVYEIIETAKAMESVDDFKKYLRENPDALEI